MIKSLRFTLFVTLLGAVLFLANSNGRADGANQGNTGAPGDELLSNGQPRTCISCHGQTNILVDMDIEVSNDGTPVTAYTPNQTYDVTVRLNHNGGNTPSGYGFQAVALIDGNESDVNGWSDPAANVKIATASNTGRSYVEHDGVSDTNSFSMKWTAPAENSGSVTIYACGNGVNRNGTTGGDGAACQTLQLTENVGTNTKQLLQADVSLFPNPTQDQVFFSAILHEQPARVIVQLLDGNGRQLASRFFAPNQTIQSVFDVKQYPAGTYYLQFHDGKNVLTKKVIKK